MIKFSIVRAVSRETIYNLTLFSVGLFFSFFFFPYVKNDKHCGNRLCCHSLFTGCELDLISL